MTRRGIVPPVLAVLAAWPVPAALHAAENAAERPRYRIGRASGPIVIDGAVDEVAWHDALRLGVDIEVQPGENLPAPVQAECFLTYSSRALYIGCRCADPEPAAIRAHLADRDTIWRNDFVGIILDTFNDQRRAYEFLVNPLGVQGDGLRNEVGSDNDEDFTWDAIWESAGRITAQGYEVEMAIPFRAIRFPNGTASHTWGIALFRAYPRTVRHQLLSVPLDRNNNCLLCQVGLLEGLEGIAPGHDLELAPTLTAARSDGLRDEENPASGLARGDLERSVGVTGRWGMTPNTSLQATVNPDFSQVEADALQLAINTRFALFYPEKRPFFMEGSDFFSMPIQAVYTRAVADPAWGVRSTGKLGRTAYSLFVARDRRLNLLFPSNEGSSYESYELANTSGVFRYRYDVGEASTLGVVATVREGGEYANRLLGADGKLRLSATDSLSFQMLRSASRLPPAIAGNEAGSRLRGTAWQLSYEHDTRDWALWAWYRSLSPGFRADLGYLTRVDTRGGEVGGQRVFWGRPGQFLTRARLGGEVSRMEDHAGTLTDQQVEAFSSLEGPYQSWLHVRVSSFKEYFQGVTYTGTRMHLFCNVRPTGDFTASLAVRLGDDIDYSNGRAGRSMRLSPAFTLNLGRHLYAEVEHVLERLVVAEGRLYTARLVQARLVYQFTASTFARLVVQYLDLAQNPALYLEEVEGRHTGLFTQFLLSYKLNPQTVAFLGYADNRDGEERLDLGRTNRTFFLKLGYAWLR